jgi:hypothetical protein
MLILSIVASALALALGRERNCEFIGFIPDRDKMTTWCDGVWEEVLARSAYVYCVNHPEVLNMDGTGLETARLDKRHQAQKLDEFVRAPDWLAGTIAAWDREKNLVYATDETHTKGVDFLQNVLTDAANCAFLHLDIAKGAPPVANRILVLRQPPGEATSETGPRHEGGSTIVEDAH